MEAQAEKLSCQLCHCKNGLDANISTAEEQTQGSNSFPSASVCVVFCFYGDTRDGSSMEGDTGTEEREKLLFLSSLLLSRLCL